MKKITALIFALILTLGLVGCNGKTVNIDFPFEFEDVESVEMYHYNGAPASAEKKVVVAESDIKTLYDMFKGLFQAAVFLLKKWINGGCGKVALF